MTNLRDFMGADTGGPETTCWGQKPEFEWGIGYFGAWEDPYAGFPEHIRRNVSAIGSLLPTHLRNWNFHRHNFTEDFNLIYDQMLRYTNITIGKYWAEIHQMVPTDAMLRRVVEHAHLTPTELRLCNKSKIVYLVIERDRVAESTAGYLNQFSQVWTTCDRSALALFDSGVQSSKIRLVSMPYRPNDKLLHASRPLHTDVPRFYHIGKYEPRKAQDKMLVAFMMAFQPEKAKLVIKTSTPFFRRSVGATPATIHAAVQAALAHPAVQANGWTNDNIAPSIRIDDRYWSQDQLNTLHMWGDVYLSLAHGEGWDMPAFDAKLIGNKLVYACSGGPEVFATPSDIALPTKKIPAHPVYGWDAMYWDYDLDNCVDMLQQAAKTYHDTEQLDLQKFSMTEVGNVMVKNVSEVYFE